jgi:hypothetical protein
VRLPRAKLTPVDAKDVQPGDVVNLEFDERADRDLDGLYFYFYLIVSSVAPRANGRVRLEFDGSCSGMTVSQRHQIWVVVEVGDFVPACEI